MLALDKPPFDTQALHEEIVFRFADNPDRALVDLFTRYLQAIGASYGALYRIEGRNAPSLIAGVPDPDLHAAVVADLAKLRGLPSRADESGSAISVTMLRSGGGVIGALTFLTEGGDNAGGGAESMPIAGLLPLFSLGLQITRWRYEAEHVRNQRETSTIRTLTHYTENILHSIAAGVLTIDKNGHVVTWNARAEDIVGIEPRHIVGRHFRELIRLLRVDPDVRDETIRMARLITETGKVFTHNKLCYDTPNGDELYINLSASQLKSETGEYLGLVVIFEDITDEVQMKEEVERVSKLAEAGELAANIAHELRNPLSSIKGAAQLLRDSLPSEIIVQHEEFLDIIIEEVNGLNRMTTEFLEFARAAPTEIQSVDLNVLVGKMLQLMSTYLAEQQVIPSENFDFLMPNILMDKMQIEQVIKNIVINAAQAMPGGGSLTVTTHFRTAHETAELVITDTGVGIEPNRLEKIWTPFFTTKTKGTGLGLAIARKIVEAHGGRLTVRSNPGSGSAFTMVLPANSPQAVTMRGGRAEIAEQRSDQPGGVFYEEAAHTANDLPRDDKALNHGN